LTGAPARKEFLPLLLEELSPSNEDLRRPRFNKSEIAPDRPFEVVVVGAGMSGILIGIRLAQAGIPFTILEKNQDAGGTWFLNSYPGCRVDNSNHFYSYSFAQRNDWPYSFSPQPVLLDYFQTCAREFGIRDHIRFGTRVEKAKWHEETSVWRIQAQGPDGNVQSFEAQALISGHVAQNWPFGLFEFWQQTRSAEKSDYEIT
jgi:4-hydroxyacetophenone monooxygenase